MSAPQSDGSTPRETIAAAVVVAVVVLAALWLMRPREDGSGWGRAAAAPALSLDAPIALDTAVRTGTLRNGMRFYVRANGAPEGRAELRLVVDAGSVLEDDDQRGLAHALEHMLFRGTRHFPGRRASEFLQSVGMREGDDINASTGTDETIYRLTVPTDSAGVLDTAIAILADWAYEATLDSAAARREAGIVFEEWRTRMGAYRRLVEARDTLLLGGSRYAGRPTIGDTAVLRKFDVGAIRRFYRDWYRPELMAVVAVGDFDATDVEGQIERRFGAIPASRDPRPRPRPTVSRPAADRPRVAVLSDPEAAETRAALWFPREPGSVRTVGEYRLTLVEELGRDLLGARLESAADHPGSPLLGAWVSLRPLVRPLEAHVVSGSVVEGRLGEAIAALTAEVARLQRFGVSEGELERAREVLLRRYRESASAGDYSDEIAGALARLFLEGAPVLPSEEHYLLAQRLLPEVRVTDITRFAHALPLGSGAVVVTLPPGPRPAWLTADSLLAAARAGAALAVDARYDSAAVARLMPQKPEPGRVVQRRVIAGVDVFEWTLGNGMRVLLKPTNFDSDEILMRIAGPGGASLAEPGEYASAYMADRVLEATGVGPLGGTRLARLLEETSVGLSPVVTDEWVQLSGSAAPRDAETMFQLAHLYFTAPRADSAAFRRYQDRSRSFERSRAADPDAAFGDTVAATLRPRDPRALAASRAFADAVDMETALRFWRARVVNASNFTVVLVGDLTLDRMRPLVERYLASLPAGHAEQPREMGPRFPAGAVSRAFRRGIDPKAHTQLVLGGPLEPTPAASNELSSTRELTELVLQARLRELMGGTYGVAVWLETHEAPRPEYALHVAFDAAPERVDSLVGAALAELERLRTAGPSSDEVEKVKAAETRDADESRQGNHFWAAELTVHARRGWSLESITEHDDEVARLSRESLRDACRRYLATSRVVRVTMYPAGRPPDTEPDAEPR